MNSYNLSVIFHPSIFTHPSNANQNCEESALSRLLLQFLINNSKSIIKESLIIIYNYDQYLLNFKSDNCSIDTTLIDNSLKSLESATTLPVQTKIHFEEVQGKSSIHHIRSIRFKFLGKILPSQFFIQEGNNSKTKKWKRKKKNILNLTTKKSSSTNLEGWNQNKR